MNKKQLIGDAKNLYISARGYDRDGLPTDWFFDQLADLCEKYHQEKLEEIKDVFKIDDRELNTKNRLLQLQRRLKSLEPKTEPYFDVLIEIAKKRTELTVKQQFRTKLNTINANIKKEGGV